MGKALLGGLKGTQAFNATKLLIYDQHQSRVEQLTEEYGVDALQHLGELTQHESTIVLCVKPHDLPVLVSQLPGAIHPKSLLISILAGTSLMSLHKTCRFEGSTIRAMPNMAATIGLAATALCASPASQEEDKTLAFDIFASVGEAYWTKESLMDTVTGLSGSGPAYIYMVIEAMTDGGVKMGLPRELARNLSVQTVLGASALVKQTGLHPAILKDQVTTPAGTTISALHELEERGLRSMFVSAVEKATLRSQSLSEYAKAKDSD